MENNGIKNSVEEDLKEVRKCKLDILILQRQNEELCQKNNAEITRLTTVIEDRLFQAEDDLKKSVVNELKTIKVKTEEFNTLWCKGIELLAIEKRKIETPAGSVTYKLMPDNWEYDLTKLFKWAKEDEDRKEKYIKVVEEFKKAVLKDDITKGLLTYDDMVDEGLTIKKQEPKFNYKLNGGVL